MCDVDVLVFVAWFVVAVWFACCVCCFAACDVLFVVWCMLLVVCCVLYDVCCLLFVGCWCYLVVLCAVLCVYGVCVGCCLWFMVVAS